MIELYNGHIWATDPISQRRNLMAAAAAHFEARKPIDRLAEVTGTPYGVGFVQLNTGKHQRIAGRDYVERAKKKP